MAQLVTPDSVEALSTALMNLTAGHSGVGYWKDGRAGSLLKKIQAERACGLNGAALWKRVASVTTANT